MSKQTQVYKEHYDRFRLTNHWQISTYLWHLLIAGRSVIFTIAIHFARFQARPQKTHQANWIYTQASHLTLIQLT